MANPIGIYIHIPFCKSKCDYCDFYSLAGQEEQMDRYQRALRIRESLAQELSPGIFVRTTHVHLRGAIDYSVLTTRHRLMMKGLCTLLRRQPAEDRSPDTQALLDSYGKAVDFIDLDTLAPIQTWLEKG